MAEHMEPTTESTDIPFHAIVEQAVAGIYVLQDECFVYSNETWAAMVGYTAEEMRGMPLSRVVPAYFLPEVLSLYHKRLNSDPPSIHFVTRGVHRDGRELRVDVHGSRIVYRGRPAVLGVGIDITQRLQNEEELRRSRQQLQELSAYTVRKLEEQRLAIAREVHDVLGGMLTSIKMDATRLLRRVENAEQKELTQGLLELTQQTIETVKQISESLRPAVLDHLNLAVALEQELRQFTRRSGVLHELSVDADGPTTRLSPKRLTAIYRVFQEALTNVARHAQAQHVWVQLSVQADTLQLQLRDDGCGFDSQKPGAHALGLLSMSERTREIGGELQLASRPGQGTQLTLTAPLL